MKTILRTAVLVCLILSLGPGCSDDAGGTSGSDSGGVDDQGGDSLQEDQTGEDSQTDEGGESDGGESDGDGGTEADSDDTGDLADGTDAEDTEQDTDGDSSEEPVDPYAAGCPTGTRTTEGSDAFVAEGTCPAASNAIDPETTAPRAGWQLVALPDAEALSAVCNLGDPFTFHVRPGRGEDANKWIVFLQGGGGCGSEPTCAARWDDQPNLMCPATNHNPGYTGIFDRSVEDNPWADWTHVFVPYCSSDGFQGDAAPTSVRSYYFRGRRIIAELTAHLLDPPDGWPDLSDAELVIFGGGSAGANGFKHNVDDFATAIAPVPVLGLNDASVVAPMPGLDSAPNPLRACYMNIQPDVSCLVDEEDPDMCLDHVNVVLNHLETPTFIVMDQFDSNSLSKWDVTSLCINPQCSAESACATGVCVANRICLANTCSVDSPCADEAPCSELGCFQPECEGDGECGDGETCQQGLCATSQRCSGFSDTSCGTGRRCLPKNNTPIAQEFAMRVRDLLADYPALYSGRTGIHVLTPKDEFWAEVDEHPSLAEIFENWVFEGEGATRYVWPPQGE